MAKNSTTRIGSSFHSPQTSATLNVIIQVRLLAVPYAPSTVRYAPSSVNTNLSTRTSFSSVAGEQDHDLRHIWHQPNLQNGRHFCRTTTQLPADDVEAATPAPSPSPTSTPLSTAAAKCSAAAAEFAARPPAGATIADRVVVVCHRGRPRWRYSRRRRRYRRSASAAAAAVVRRLSPTDCWTVFVARHGPLLARRLSEMFVLWLSARWGRVNSVHEGRPAAVSTRLSPVSRSLECDLSHH